jgi:hypothetical protein
MKQITIIFFLLFSFSLHGQNVIEWDGKYRLELNDFQSPTTQIGEGHIIYIHTPSSFGFAFQMNYFEFMFTRNFNSKVNNPFDKDAASIVAPDTSTALNLLEYARYTFDLSELYARKFRKKLFEEKKVFSDVNFYLPIYNEIHRKFTERHALAGKLTELGQNREKLRELHDEVLREIEMLADFCKTCKPKKQNKK